MNKKIIKFDGTEIEEYEFHQYETFGEQDFKYFIGYKDNKEIRHLFIFFPEMIIYSRYSYMNKCMYFMIKDENIFDKYVIILEKVSNIIIKN